MDVEEKNELYKPNWDMWSTQDTNATFHGVYVLFCTSIEYSSDSNLFCELIL